MRTTALYVEEAREEKLFGLLTVVSSAARKQVSAAEIAVRHSRQRIVVQLECYALHSLYHHLIRRLKTTVTQLHTVKNG